MSSTFRFHSDVNEIVPANATYTFPTQSTKVNKQTIKLVPKNGSTFTSGSVVRIEFPADNYMNVLNSVLQWDVSVQRAPILVTGAMTASMLNSPTQSTGVLLNTDMVVTFISHQSAGTTITISAAQAGSYLSAAAEGTYTGCILTVHRGGLVFPAVIAHSAAYVANVTNLYTTNNLYLSTPLACGPVLVGDVLVIHYPQTWQRGGAQNAIKRLRVIYGSLVLEDIYEYKTLVRILYESGVPQQYSASQGQITDGMYSTSTSDWAPQGRSGPATLAPFDYINDIGFSTATTKTTASNCTHSTAVILQNQILGKVTPQAHDQAKLDLTPQVYVSPSGTYSSTAPYNTTYNFGAKTYTLNLLSGIFTQKKLIPLKWMAAQLVIEITLATPEDCMLSPQTTATTAMTVNYTNVNFIAEMLEFDSVYDTGFYDCLRNGGIPLKFGTFHYHTFNMSGSNQVVQIHERSRSVKAAFAVIRTTQANSVIYDSDRFFHDTGATFGGTNGDIYFPQVGAVDTFQWRVGGRYYPAQPVRCQFGGSEAYLELGKALDNVGDYTRGSQIASRNWSTGNGGRGSSFIMACEFENTDVFPDTIAGINAEEQSDIALTVITDPRTVTFNYSTAVDAVPALNKKIDVFMFIDALMIVRDGNVVDMVI